MLNHRLRREHQRLKHSQSNEGGIVAPSVRHDNNPNPKNKLHEPNNVREKRLLQRPLKNTFQPPTRKSHHPISGAKKEEHRDNYQHDRYASRKYYSKQLKANPCRIS